MAMENADDMKNRGVVSASERDWVRLKELYEELRPLIDEMVAIVGRNLSFDVPSAEQTDLWMLQF